MNKQQIKTYQLCLSASWASVHECVYIEKNTGMLRLGAT